MRTLARTVASLVAPGIAFAAAPAQSQTLFPTKPLRILVPCVPGGAVDVILRIYTPHIVETLGQPLVIENKAGGAKVDRG